MKQPEAIMQQYHVKSGVVRLDCGCPSAPTLPTGCINALQDTVTTEGVANLVANARPWSLSV